MLDVESIWFIDQNRNIKNVDVPIEFINYWRFENPFVMHPEFTKEFQIFLFVLEGEKDNDISVTSIFTHQELLKMFSQWQLALQLTYYNRKGEIELKPFELFKIGAMAS